MGGLVDIDPKAGGGLFALRLSDGKRVWAITEGCKEPACSPAQSAAVTMIPGVIFSGGVDGHLRAYAARDGKIVWDVDTVREYETVNGVKGYGRVGGRAESRRRQRSPDGEPGYALLGGMPGNVLLAFSVDGKQRDGGLPYSDPYMSSELRIQCPDGQMKTIPLTGERLSVGRSSAAELCFPEDAGLSRQHFAFEAARRRLDRAGPGQQERHLRQQHSAEGATDSEAWRPDHRRAPGDRLLAGRGDPDAGVVVFEGGESSSPTTSTVVTSLEGALSNQTMAIERGGPKASAPMQALIRAGQEFGRTPAHRTFPVILDLAIQAVNAQRGVLLILEGDTLVPRRTRATVSASAPRCATECSRRSRPSWCATRSSTTHSRAA